MMWSSIANLKENLNKIAHDVHEEDDDDEELEIYGSMNGREASPISDRRNSHSFAHSKSAVRSPVANGIDSPHNPEVWYWFPGLNYCVNDQFLKSWLGAWVWASLWLVGIMCFLKIELLMDKRTVDCWVCRGGLRIQMVHWSQQCPILFQVFYNVKFQLI